MNIFLLEHKKFLPLEPDPIASACSLSDQHLNEAIVRCCQMLATAHIVLDGEDAPTPSKIDGTKYKATHKNHPCSIWIRHSSDAYAWTLQYAISAVFEWRKRKHDGRRHGCELALQWLVRNKPTNLSSGSITYWELVMPDKYKQDNPVDAYREYYRKEKLVFQKKGAATWVYPGIKPIWI